MTQINQSMMIINMEWDNHSTFRMIPITEECPYIDAVFNLAERILIIYNKEFKEKPVTMVKLSSNGTPITLHAADKNNPVSYAEERVLMNSYYEYYIKDVNDIQEFIKLVAINPQHPAASVITDPIV